MNEKSVKETPDEAKMFLSNGSYGSGSSLVGNLKVIGSRQTQTISDGAIQYFPKRLLTGFRLQATDSWCWCCNVEEKRNGGWERAHREDKKK